MHEGGYQPSPAEMEIKTPQEDQSMQTPHKERIKRPGVMRQAKRILEIGAIIAVTFMPLKERVAAAQDLPDAGQTEKAGEHKWTEDEKQLLSEMRYKVVDKSAELDSAYYAVTGENLPPELIDSFQKAGQELSERVVQQGEDLKVFEVLLQTFYAENLQELVPEKEAEVLENKQEAAPSSIEILPDSVELSKDWMWQNAGKLFRRGDKLIAVAQAKSKDQQFAANKALQSARSMLAEHSNIPSADGKNRTSSVSISMSREIGEDTVQSSSDGLFETVVIVEVNINNISPIKK